MKNLQKLQGFTLVECLLYFGVLSVIAGLAFCAYFNCQKNTRQLQAFSNQLLRTMHAGERWRAEIRSARGVPFLLDDSKFCIPSETGKVIYSLSDGTLWRQIDEKNSKVEVIKGIKTSVMHLDEDAHIHAWRWELELSPSTKQSKNTYCFTFKAVNNFQK
jgi:Tfp pilus assembly protein PilE